MIKDIIMATRNVITTMQHGKMQEIANEMIKNKIDNSHSKKYADRDKVELINKHIQ